LKVNFDKMHKWAEFASFLALILGVPFGLVDLHNHATEAEENAKKERVEAAEKAYQMVDQRFHEFVKLCIDHPQLDCYSTPRVGEVKLNENEKIQQKLLFAELTDVFEVAYVQYHKEDSNPEIRRIYETQWSGWDAYIRKFFKRPAYVEAWYEIRDEYDGLFVQYLNSLAPPQKKLAAANESIR
jgi:hypothetical protein